MDASVDAPPRRSFAFGLERLGLIGLAAPAVTVALIVVMSALAVWGLTRLRVDDSLSELFRTDTEEFRRYEEIDRRFPSSEYDVLVVVEGKDLLQEAAAGGIPARHRSTCSWPTGWTASFRCFRRAASRTPAAMRRRSCPTSCPTGPSTTPSSSRCATTTSSRASSSPPDGELALAVIALDRKAVQKKGAKDDHRRHQQAAARGAGAGRPQVAPDGRAGDAARDPQRGGARPDRLQRPGAAVRRHHRRHLLQARVADAAGGAAAGAGGAVVAGPARLARIQASTSSSTS